MITAHWTIFFRIFYDDLGDRKYFSIRHFWQLCTSARKCNTSLKLLFYRLREGFLVLRFCQRFFIAGYGDCIWSSIFLYTSVYSAVKIWDGATSYVFRLSMTYSEKIGTKRTSNEIFFSPFFYVVLFVIDSHLYFNINHSERNILTKKSRCKCL